MKFVVNNGILEMCILEGNERTIKVPDTVKEISANVFAGNTEDALVSIKSLVLPESLEHIHYQAFIGLGPLKSITVYSYGKDEFRLYSENSGEREWEAYLFNSLVAEKLVIIEGKRGKRFVLCELFDQMPKDISVFSDADLSLIYRDDYTIDSGRDIFRSLTVYGEGHFLSRDSKVYSYICCAEKVQYINTRIGFFEDRYSGFTEKIWYGPCPETMQLRSIIDYVDLDGSKESPYSWSSIDTLKPRLLEEERLHKLVLPAGLQKIDDNIIRCNNLRKLVIPADVKSISHSIRYCPSLSSLHVEIHADSDLEVDSTSFFECPKLKMITLYEQDIRTGYKKIIKKVPKTEWLKYHFKKRFFDEFSAEAPEAVDKVLSMAASKLWQEQESFDEGDNRRDYDSSLKEQEAVIYVMSRIVPDSTAFSDTEKIQIQKCINKLEMIERAVAFT